MRVPVTSRTRRAVITGLGVVAPGGIGAKAFWEMLTAGRTATRPITLFDASPFRCRIAAEVDFDPAREGLSPKEIRRMDRAGEFAVVATREALADSGLGANLDRSRLGVSLGSAIGNSTRMEEEYVAISDGGRDWLVDHRFTVPYSYSYIAASSLATEVAWAAGAEGPAVIVSAGCTSGLDAVGHAVQLVEDGTADVMVTGSTDAPLTPITMACFDALQGHHAEKRRPGQRLSSLSPRQGRHRARRGRGHVHRGGARARPPPQREHPRRSARLRQPCQRVPHDRPAARRP